MEMFVRDLTNIAPLVRGLDREEGLELH